MTENRNHGFNIRFYFGIILLIAAVSLLSSLSKSRREQHWMKALNCNLHQLAANGDETACQNNTNFN